jgi:glycosyltransferase involved in cell wall biosynthesis
MNNIPVTAIIPVKNEEINLPECLKRVEEFDQIIVVDSSSTDATPQIAKQNRISKFYMGRYIPQKT